MVTPAPRARAAPVPRVPRPAAEIRRQLRRDRLLDAALELFATRGYARTSIEQLCSTAGVGFKAFYEEYETKENLLLALYDDLAHRLPALEEARVLDVRSADARLRGALERFVGALVDDPRVGLVLYVESAGVSPAVEERRRRTNLHVADLFVEHFYAGTFGSMPADRHPGAGTLSLGVVGGMAEILRAWLLDPGHAEPDLAAPRGDAAKGELLRHLDEYFHLVLHGALALSV